MHGSGTSSSYAVIQMRDAYWRLPCEGLILTHADIVACTHACSYATESLIEWHVVDDHANLCVMTLTTNPATIMPEHDKSAIRTELTISGSQTGSRLAQVCFVAEGTSWRCCIHGHRASMLPMGTSPCVPDLLTSPFADRQHATFNYEWVRCVKCYNNKFSHMPV